MNPLVTGAPTFSPQAPREPTTNELRKSMGLEPIDFSLPQATEPQNPLGRVLEGFDGEIERALKHHEQSSSGGQQVPFHGDFANVPISGLTRMRWWLRAIRETAGIES